MKRVVALVLVLALSLTVVIAQSPKTPRLRLATTTSTEQSGLLAAILPAFEKESGYKVEVVAVGTGASLKLGQDGNADVVLVHSRVAEDAFIAAGWGIDRRDVMYNDFILLGAVGDPAGIANATGAVDAFARIFKAGSIFVSRGDKSGTDDKEKEIWKIASLAPKGLGWYREIGQGMSQAIMMADQVGGYTIADRATWISMKGKTGLKILSQGDKLLFNPYGIITVNPAKWPASNVEGAKALSDWMTGPMGKALIIGYKLGGEQLFYLFQ
ncbi:MAG: substrate-binding domain-containing protein [Spirochaetota bacterium]